MQFIAEKCRLDTTSKIKKKKSLNGLNSATKTKLNTKGDILRVFCHYSLQCSSWCLCESETEVAQSCPTLCDPMDCSLPSSSVHEIFQAIVLEWIAISFSRGSSRSRDRTQVFHIVDRHFTIWATREALVSLCRLY